MKKVLLIFILLASVASAHDLRHEAVTLRHWNINGSSQVLDASFLIFRNDTVFLEDAKENIVRIPMHQLSAADQKFVGERVSSIAMLNESRAITSSHAHTHESSESSWPLVLLALSLVTVAIALKLSAPRTVIIPLIAVTGFALISAGPTGLHTMHTTTDPNWLDSAFSPFKPNINTFWDTTYFHVESRGIPTTHSMMTGITKWQQQVPIPQCYLGNNSWSIPLNPVLAATPVPVSPQHFFRGAVAVAVNGIPIFNPYTNTGVDALVDGQLDNWGGHSGRADDYHYHIAPLHLYNHVAQNAPIAFGLDGYAVYGDFEPDGTPVLPLDTNHGHFGSNGVYHYHGTVAAPYMIGNMVGQVTEDTTLQIIPQPRANPVRPSLTPLNGAAIVGFHDNGANGYTLIYTLSGQTDSIAYSWNTTGQYTYNFYTQGNGIPVVQNYNGFIQCTVPTGISSPVVNAIKLYPNPVIDNFKFTGISSECTLIIYDSKGVRSRTQKTSGESIRFDEPSGIYYYELITNTGRYTGRFVKL
jgi:hypothetical protein